MMRKRKNNDNVLSDLYSKLEDSSDILWIPDGYYTDYSKPSEHMARVGVYSDHIKALLSQRAVQ